MIQCHKLLLIHAQDFLLVIETDHPNKVQEKKLTMLIKCHVKYIVIYLNEYRNSTLFCKPFVYNLSLSSVIQTSQTVLEILVYLTFYIFSVIT